MEILIINIIIIIIIIIININMQLYGCKWIQGVTNCKRCLIDSSAVQCSPSVLICVSSHSFNIINNNVNKIAESWSIRHVL